MRYLECRESIYSQVTFVFTNINTAVDLLVTRMTPIALEIQHLQLSFILPIARENPEDDPKVWKQLFTPWLSLCQNLSNMVKLRQVNIWLDAKVSGYREYLLKSPQLYPFDARVATLVILNLPVDEEENLPHLKNLCSIVKRGRPQYHWDWDDISTHPWSIEAAIVHSHRLRRRLFSSSYQ